MNKTVATIILIVVIVALCGVMIWGMAAGTSLWGSASNCGGIRIGSWYSQGPLPADASSGQYAEQAPGQVNGILLDFTDENIEVVVTDENVIRVEQKSETALQDEEIMRYGMINGTFVAQSGNFGRNFVGITSRTPSTVVLSVPKELNLPLTLSTTSGFVQIEGGTYRSLDLDTMSGWMTAKGVVAATIDASSTSGSLVLDQVSCESMQADTMSGSIEISGDAGHSLLADSTSGEILFEGSAEQADVDTMSGDIRLTISAPEALSVDSTSGSVSIECGDASRLREIDVDTMSGGVSVALPENEGFTVEFDSLSGSLHNQFEVTNNVHKTGKIAIYVDTTSGSLDILRKS